MILDHLNNTRFDSNAEEETIKREVNSFSRKHKIAVEGTYDS